MKTYIPLIIGVVFYVVIQLLPKTNTRIGEALRRSDHAAWQYAVEDKERELTELKQAEPR